MHGGIVDCWPNIDVPQHAAPLPQHGGGLLHQPGLFPGRGPGTRQHMRGGDDPAQPAVPRQTHEIPVRTFLVRDSNTDQARQCVAVGLFCMTEMLSLNIFLPEVNAALPQRCGACPRCRRVRDSPVRRCSCRCRCRPCGPPAPAARSSHRPRSAAPAQHHICKYILKSPIRCNFKRRAVTDTGQLQVVPYHPEVSPKVAKRIQAAASGRCRQVHSSLSPSLSIGI